MNRRLVVLVTLTLASAGCLAHRDRVAGWATASVGFGEVSDTIVAALVEDGDKAWAARGDPRQVPEAMRAYRAALHERPGDPSLMVHLGRLAFYRAQLHGGKGAALLYSDAASWAERALAMSNPPLAQAALANKKPSDIFALAQPSDEDALVLYAESILWWAIDTNTTTVIDQKAMIEAAAGRALALDRSAGYGAPDRVLAVLACELPVARQNLREALDHFEAAIAAAPAYLPTRLLYAEEYAVRMREAPMYRRLLHEVVTSDAHALVDAQPENEAAQREAQKLLKWLQ